MSWSLERTRKLIDICPALTVAIYSSRQGDSGKGVLTILARNGRACDPNFNYEQEFKHGGGNVVDGPALAWLVKQPGPRVWFSDGQVSGKGDQFRLGALEDAFRLAAVGQVTRTVSFEQVVGVLGGKIKPNPIRPDFVAAIHDVLKHGKRPADVFQGTLTEELEYDRRMITAYSNHDRGYR